MENRSDFIDVVVRTAAGRKLTMSLPSWLTLRDVANLSGALFSLPSGVLVLLEKVVSNFISELKYRPQRHLGLIVRLAPGFTPPLTLVTLPTVERMSTQARVRLICNVTLNSS